MHSMRYPSHLLLIEDDTRLADMVNQYLTNAGFTCTQATSAIQGMHSIGPLKPDLIILDLMLPDMDGLTLCQRIRSTQEPWANTPILMLTAKGDPVDRILGLESGADDYLAKPFEPRELLARIKAILRRGKVKQNQKDHQQILRFGSLEINLANHHVTVNKKPCSLTAYQFKLLVILAQRAGQVLNREQIVNALSGTELEAFDRSVDVHIGRIRSAIEDNVKKPKRILTIRGVGYVFTKQQP
jgi:DNA-binding response OmpR family regulator